jgi:uncharacterized membrane protein YesL
MMSTALGIVRDAFRDMWEDLWSTLVCNLAWYVANLLIVPGPPATLALMYYANRLAHGETADWQDFWNAFRHYWGPAWRWGAINLGITVFLLADIVMIGPYSQQVWGQYLTGLYLALLAGWMVMQVFSLPFLFEQETMSVRRALQNGAALIGKNLGFAFALTGLLLLILIAGVVLFMLSFIFGAVLIACTGNRAVLNRLEIVKQSKEVSSQ